MSEWQSIEKAPKDGTKILAAELLLGTIWVTQVCEFFEGKWILPWDGGAMDPNYWMPLPEPPEGEQE